MLNAYSLYVEKNEEEIINDFCDKIRNDLIGDLTLDEYSKFRFWKDLTSDELRFFYKKFRKETKTDMNYNSFCEYMWFVLDPADESIPDEVRK